ncbi:MAG: hypothetical protein NZ108_05800 [Bacteroidia bacterium]|nr:hypothetical protein [Bacteroidia bacterium]
MNLFEKFFLNKASFTESNLPVITLLYEKLPILNKDQLKTVLASIEPSQQTQPTVEIEKDFNDGGVLLAEVSFGEHRIEVIGIQAPVPKDVVERCVLPSHWAADIKELIQSHRGNVVLCYAGSDLDPVEQYLALYKVAAGLYNDNLVGVLNEAAWSCHPAPIIPKLVSDELIQVCRDSPPLIFWTGFFITETEEGFWFFTKGYHLFGLRELVFFSEQPEDVPSVMQLFNELFYYLFFEKASVQVGDILRLNENDFFEFSEPSQENPLPHSVQGYFWIRPVNSNDIHFDEFQ